MTGDCLLEVSTLDALARPGANIDWLAPAETLRLQAIQAPLRRRQYLAGHWLVRELAARLFGGAPEQWRWDDQAGPRPQLLREGMRAWATLSHSGEHLAAAVALRPIGLDLERPHRRRDVMALAQYMFAPDEVERLADSTEGPGRERLFYTLWALKEARGKRGGEGLQATQARRVSARPCDPTAAEAWVWPLETNGALALAAWPGAEVHIRPADITAPESWHYQPVD
jgi:4'-phosphopantetheinyl transferase